MTKQEWLDHYRAVRVWKRDHGPKIEYNSKLLLQALHELYDYHWTPKQQAFINLCDRYKDKIGPERFELIESWKPYAKERASIVWRNFVYTDNPFLKIMPKEESNGKY